MTRALKVFKFSAAGNDFVLIDLRAPQNCWLTDKNYPSISRRLSLEFATDGVLFIQNFRQRRKLIFLNPDGSRAFCGNGTRTVGYYEVNRSRKKKNGSAKVLTDVGLIHVDVANDAASLRGVKAPEFLGKCSLKLPRSMTFYKVSSGCPHAVTFVDNLDKVNVDTLGRKARYCAQFAPQGSNVDFVKVLNKNTFEMRTYERGVEKETASCGSGVLAAGFLMKHLKLMAHDNLTCKMKGGNFNISFDEGGCLTLTSQVKKIFEGEAYV